MDPLPDWQEAAGSLWFDRNGFLNAPAPLVATGRSSKPPDKAAHAFLAAVLHSQMFAVFEQVSFCQIYNLKPGHLHFDLAYVRASKKEMRRSVY